jgi:hypothetical protein
MKERWVHGWPGGFLVRDALVHHPNPLAVSPSSVYFYHPTLTDCFSLTLDLQEVRWWMLGVNCACILLSAFAFGLLFEFWRRQRVRLFQIYLRDCLLASLFVSCAAAWCVHKYRPWTVEQRFSSQARDSEDGFPPLTVTRQLRSSLLQLCLPEQRWVEPFNPPLELQLWNQLGWANLHHFPEASLLKIQVSTTSKTQELAHLSSLPNLEAIDYSYSSGEADAQYETAELPPLPNLRGLAVFVPAHCCRRLDRLTGLEYIRIGDGYVDEEALREVAQLSKLRHVALGGLEPGADLSFLPRLANLTAADFYHSELDEDALRHISQCSGLVELSLYSCDVDDKCIPYLARLTRLRDLDLQSTHVKDIHRLRRALPNCRIEHSFRLKTLPMTHLPLSIGSVIAAGSQVRWRCNSPLLLSLSSI